MSPRRVDVAVVGAGPAGVAAACRAAEAGREVALLDEGLGAGGQIWRHLPGSAAPAEARPWLERLASSGAVLHPGAAVFDLARVDGGFRAAAWQGGARLDLLARRLVLATGARELLLPFPGWTLPLVTGAGGAQALAKGGLDVRGRRVVLAGTGPLLLAVAEALDALGADVLAVAEQARAGALAGLAVRLAGHPGKLGQALRFARALGLRYRTGTWVARAEGGAGAPARVEAAVLTDGRREERLPCDLLGVSFGLVPGVEAARLLGARVERGAVAVDGSQETSVQGLLAAGEICGVAGAEVALAEGQLAGLAAAGRPAEPALASARRAGRSLAAAMDRAFALRPDLLRPLPPETIVCRCEDVRAGDLDPGWTGRQARLYSRAGMGPCQGRVCGAALNRLHGWELETPRSPLLPVPLSALLPEDRP